jgi:hypothetical protein
MAAVADERISPADLTRLTERQLIRDGLERLGGKCRDLLEALFSAPAEPNYTLISARLGLRIGSIGPTRARCLEKLSVILGHLGFGPEPEVATTDAGQERSSDRPKAPGQSRATPTNDRPPDD